MTHSELINAEQAKMTKYISQLAKERFMRIPDLANMLSNPEFSNMLFKIEVAETKTIWELPEATLFINLVTFINIKEKTGQTERQTIEQLDSESRNQLGTLFDFGKRENVPMNIKDYLKFRIKIQHNGFDITMEAPGFLEYYMKKIISDYAFNSIMHNEVNSISEIFLDLTTNQRKSFINLLILTAQSDEIDDDMNEKEKKFIANYVEILGVNIAICMNYFNSGGAAGIIDDLKTLSLIQKDCLLNIIIKLIICDNNPTELEMRGAYATLSLLDINPNLFITNYNKIVTIIKSPL